MAYLGFSGGGEQQVVWLQGEAVSVSLLHYLANDHIVAFGGEEKTLKMWSQLQRQQNI